MSGVKRGQGFSEDVCVCGTYVHACGGGARAHARDLTSLKT